MEGIDWIKNEVSLLLKVQDRRRQWQIPFLVAISMGVPLFLGYFLGNMKYGLLASISGLVILYVPSKGSFTNRVITLLTCSFGFMISFAIGQIFSFSQLGAVIAFGVFSLVTHWINLYYKTSPPRSFFFLMIAALSICQPFNWEAIPTKVGLIGLGTMFSCLLSLGLIASESFQTSSTEREAPQSVLKVNSMADFWEAIILGGFMAISLGLGYILQLENPYWIPVSCAAVMQGASRYHIWQRTFQRILGTLLGLALCWVLVSLTDSLWVICLFIVLLQLIVEFLVVKNYALAVVFITPLAILLSEAASPIISSPNELIQLRFVEILLGSILGAIGGWLLHKEKIRFAAQIQLRKIGVTLED